MAGPYTRHQDGVNETILAAHINELQLGIEEHESEIAGLAGQPVVFANLQKGVGSNASTSQQNVWVDIPYLFLDLVLPSGRTYDVLTQLFIFHTSSLLVRIDVDGLLSTGIRQISPTFVMQGRNAMAGGQTLRVQAQMMAELSSNQTATSGSLFAIAYPR